MEFIEAPAFSKHVSGYLNDDEYRRLQAELTDNPEAGDIVPGTGGFRKIRWADVRRGKVGEVGCGLCTTTLGPIIRYG